MSAAVQEAPVEVERTIRHAMDKGALLHMGADVSEKALIDEYYEYRETFKRPGPLDNATLHHLVVEQNRRKAKPAKAKG